MNSNEVYLEKEEARKILASLSSDSPFGKQIGSNNDGSVMISILSTSSEASLKAEIHDNFNDLFLVQSGAEEFWLGGEIADKKETEPGEWRGEKLKNAKKKRLKAGDILIVPKGMSHRHGLGSATFFVIKIK